MSNTPYAEALLSLRNLLETARRTNSLESIPAAVDLVDGILNRAAAKVPEGTAWIRRPFLAFDWRAIVTELGMELIKIDPRCREVTCVGRVPLLSSTNATIVISDNGGELNLSHQHPRASRAGRPVMTPLIDFSIPFESMRQSIGSKTLAYRLVQAWVGLPIDYNVDLDHPENPSTLPTGPLPGLGA